MDSLASLAFSSRSSYPRSDLSELSLRKSSSSRLRFGSLTSSDISVEFRGHPLHRCYSVESLPSSLDVCDGVSDLLPERSNSALRMSPWCMFRFKSTAGQAVDPGWRNQPPSLLPSSLSVDPPWSEWSNLKVIICPPLVLRTRTYGGLQDSRGWPSAFNDGSTFADIVPSDRGCQQELQFSSGSGSRYNIIIVRNVFVIKSSVTILFRCPVMEASSRTGFCLMVQRKRIRCRGVDSWGEASVLMLGIKSQQAQVLRYFIYNEWRVDPMCSSNRWSGIWNVGKRCFLWPWRCGGCLGPA